MSKIPFVGPSYTLRSLTVDCQRTVNLFPSINETGQGKSNLFLTTTPGLKEYLIPINNDENNIIRALFVDSKDNFYIVSGNAFIKINYDKENKIFNQVILGFLQTSIGSVSIAENGFEIALVDGDNYYLYTIADNIFSKYEPEGWLGSNTVTYFNGYFVFIERESQKFYISKVYDGKTIDPLDFASAEGSPDNLITSLSLKQNLWLFGTKTVELFYNSGNEDFPLSKQDGALIECGCIAPFSVAILDNSPVWLGRDNTGSGFVFKASGFNPEKISNFAVERAIQSYDKIEDAISYTYSQDGHTFYVLNFPSAGTTWVYDIKMQMWHERQSLNKQNGILERHRSNYHVFWQNKHLVSDFEDNIIYELDLNTYTDNNYPIKRLRRSPHFAGENLEIFSFFDFKLDMDLGDYYDLLNINNNEAQISLRYSNNGGKTWSNYLQQSLGKPGDYKKRIIWRRLGSSRDRVWEISITDPVKIILLNAYSNIKQGIN